MSAYTENSSVWDDDDSLISHLSSRARQVPQTRPLDRPGITSPSMDSNWGTSSFAHSMADLTSFHRTAMTPSAFGRSLKPNPSILSRGQQATISGTPSELKNERSEETAREEQHTINTQPESTSSTRVPSQNRSRVSMLGSPQEANSVSNQKRFASIKTQPSFASLNEVVANADFENLASTLKKTVQGRKILEQFLESKTPENRQKMNDEDNQEHEQSEDENYSHVERQFVEESPAFSVLKEQTPSQLNASNDAENKIIALEKQLEDLRFQLARKSFEEKENMVDRSQQTLKANDKTERSFKVNKTEKTEQKSSQTKATPKTSSSVSFLDFEQENLIYSDSLYQKLQMDEIDKLSLQEARNHLKKITETFKTVPFPELMRKMPVMGRYMNQDDYCMIFASDIHQILYGNRDLKRAKDGLINRACLNEMARQVDAMVATHKLLYESLMQTV